MMLNLTSQQRNGLKTKATSCSLEWLQQTGDNCWWERTKAQSLQRTVRHFLTKPDLHLQPSDFAPGTLSHRNENVQPQKNLDMDCYELPGVSPKLLTPDMTMFGERSFKDVTEVK